MPVRAGCGLSTLADPRIGAIQAAARAREQLGSPAELAVVFLSGAHLDDPIVALEVIGEILEPDGLVGCGAAGVIGGAREVEGDTAVAVWAADLEGGRATTFHADVGAADHGVVTVAGMPAVEGAVGLLLLPDPHSFPTDAMLDQLAVRGPGVPVLGGVASARSGDGGAVLLHDDVVCHGGAVGVRLDDVELLPCVSAGVRAVGPELQITAGAGNIIHELSGEPALPKLRDVVEALPSAERAAVAAGIVLGIVADAEVDGDLHAGAGVGCGTGDVQVRGLLGGDPVDGTIAVAAPVTAGQIVRLHARDAPAADRDLRDALELRRRALGDDAPTGALLFTCTGRGRGLFGAPDHDLRAVHRALGGVPTAGFFAAGEIGPVGGANLLHAFTATVAVFA